MSDTIIDLTTYNELKQNLGVDFVVELVDTYCVETPQLINQLWQALAQGEVDAFRRAAHSIKSSSASIGAMTFSAQAKDLETIAKNGELGEITPLLEKLASNYAVVERALQDLKNES